MRRMLRRVSIAMLIGVGLLVAGHLVTSVWAVIFTDFPRDRSGNVGPPVFFTGSGGTFTVVTPTDRLPVNTGPPTQATTDPTGWGKAFFDTGTTFSFNGPALVFASDELILAFQPDAGTSILTWQSRDGGRTFTLINTSAALPFNPGNSNHAIRFGGNYLYGVGGSGAFDGYLRSASGVTWTQVDLPTVVGGSVTSIHGQGSTVLAAVDTGTLFVCRSTDSGVSFASCTDHAATGIATNSQSVASPALNIWLVGDGAGTIARSTDDGVTFASVLSMGGVASHVICISATVCLAANRTGTIWRSQDAGATWAIELSVSPVPNFNGFLDFGGGTVVALSTAGLTPDFFRSIDSGGTWTIQGELPRSFSLLTTAETRNGRAIYGDRGAQRAIYSSIVGAGTLILAGEDGTKLDVDANGRLTANQGAAGTEPGWPVEGSQRATLRNSRAVSAANTAVTITIAAVAGQAVRLYSYAGFCAAGGTSTTVQVQDGGTIVWQQSQVVNDGTGLTPPHANFSFDNIGLRGTTGNAMSVTLGACGAGVVGTISVHASQF